MEATVRFLHEFPYRFIEECNVYRIEFEICLESLLILPAFSALLEQRVPIFEHGFHVDLFQARDDIRNGMVVHDRELPDIR